uniref:CUE domain-containing protein n=1 Tax=Lepeophtheirus salmonis TaxID=72036 RepID=A0A0K2U1X5_LEPSM
MTSDNSNVIFYMKLMHELKAEYPNVPDEAVKDTIIKYCGDKELCIRELSAQSLFLSRSKRAMKEGKFSTQRALLTHQMEQCLKLDQELRSERSKLNNIREEIALIEERRNKKRLLKLNAQLKRNEGIEKDIKSLRYSCDTLAAKVTKITKGKGMYIEVKFIIRIIYTNYIYIYIFCSPIRRNECGVLWIPIPQIVR